ncbi:glutaredoxin 2 [Rhizobium sp.]|uniref:glutaredoxin 2 n=1 Tax=Rhizobium sp. TaxID=391 RepID=UPI0028A92E31
MKLYVYDHCPFCVKARSIFGLKGVSFELVVMLNDDATTPERMVGRKVAPILEEEGQYLAESMDIVAKIDALDGQCILTGPTVRAVTDWLKESSSNLYALAMPRWASSELPEFATAEARAFFTQKKEAIIGPFSERLAESKPLIEAANANLARLDPLIQSADAVNRELSTDDIHLFAHLRALSIVQGVIYPHAVEAYRKRMSMKMDVPLHDNIAS